MDMVYNHLYFNNFLKISRIDTAKTTVIDRFYGLKASQGRKADMIQDAALFLPNTLPVHFVDPPALRSTG